MDLFNSISQAIYPGHRVIRVRGYQEAKDYPIPKDSEVIMIDSDPNVNYIYMKKIDINGGEKFERYLFEEDPIPQFNPEDYITKTEFNQKIEEVLNAINSFKSDAGAGK